MYYPERKYRLTKGYLSVFEEIQRNNGFVVGISKKWDSTEKKLIIDLGNGFTGIIPESELTIEELKYPNKNKNDMPFQAICTFNQKICAEITKIDGKTVYLSRRKLQEKAMASLEINKVYEVVIISVSKFGIFVDIGVGLTAFIHVSEISTTRFQNAQDVNMIPGDTISAILLSITPKMCMSYRRNISLYTLSRGDYTMGIVRAELSNHTGYFVEVSPNECGIVDSINRAGIKTELAYGSVVRCLVKDVKIISDVDGLTKIQYKLRLAK